MVTILEEALALVTGPRQALYGPPADDYARVAQITAATLSRPVTAPEAVVQMLAVKLARIGHGITHGASEAELHDSIVDLAGYAHCLHQTLIAEEN